MSTIPLGDVLHRSRDRRHLSTRIRLERLEEDADVTDAQLLQMAADLHAKLDRITTRLFAVLIAITSAAVGLVGNIILRWRP